MLSAHSAISPPRFSRLFLALLTVAILGVVYLPVFLEDYAVVDTFIVFARSRFHLSEPFFSWFGAQGRPLSSFLTWGILHPLEGLDDLRWVRLIGLLGTFALGLSLVHCLARLGVTSMRAVWVALAVCCTPGVAVFTAWTVCFTYGWAAALAVLGGFWIWEAFAAKFSPVSLLKGSVAVFISLCVYQPSALFGLIPLLTVALKSDFTSGNQAFLRTVKAFAAFTSVFGLYFLLFRFCYLPFIPEQPQNVQARLAPTLDGVKQIKMVVFQALPEMFEGWAFSAPRPVLRATPFVWMALLGLATVVGARRVSLRIFLLKGLLVGGAVALSLIPIAYYSESVPYPRIMAPTAAILSLLLLQSAVVLLDRANGVLQQGALGMLAALQVVGAAFNIRHNWVEPAARELAAYRREVKTTLESGSGAIVATTSSFWIQAGCDWRYLFGFISSSQPWILDPLIRLTVCEIEGEAAAWSLQVYVTDAESPVRFTRAINANSFIEQTWRDPKKKQLPVLEGFGVVAPLTVYDLRYLGEPWWGSEWLGAFRLVEASENGPAVLDHALYGKMEFKWEGDQLNLHHPIHGWVVTNAERFPACKRIADGTQIQLRPPTPEGDGR